MLGMSLFPTVSLNPFSATAARDFSSVNEDWGSSGCSFPLARDFDFVSVDTVLALGDVDAPLLSGNPPSCSAFPVPAEDGEYQTHGASVPMLLRIQEKVEESDCYHSLCG